MLSDGAQLEPWPQLCNKPKNQRNKKRTILSQSLSRRIRPRMKQRSLLLAATFALTSSACVFDVNGLNTGSGSTGPQNDVVVPAQGTFACGWERSFFKPVTTTDAAMVGRGIIRYDAAGNGTVLARDSRSLIFGEVLAVGTGVLVAKGTSYRGVAQVPVLAIVTLASGAVATSDLVGDVTRHDHNDHSVYVASFPASTGLLGMTEVDLATGTIWKRTLDATVSASDQSGTVRASGCALTVSLPGRVVRQDLCANSMDPAANSIAFTDGSGGAPMQVHDTAASGYTLYSLTPSSPRVDDQSLVLFRIEGQAGAIPQQLNTIPAGNGSTRPSVGGVRGNETLVASDTAIYSVDNQTISLVPVAPRQLYSYTPQFGGLQGVGISDLRVIESSSSGAATFVEPCGELNGEVLTGVRFLPAAGAVSWLWSAAGFPMLAENRALVNHNGYGYRVANITQQVP